MQASGINLACKKKQQCLLVTKNQQCKSPGLIVCVEPCHCARSWVEPWLASLGSPLYQSPWVDSWLASLGFLSINQLFTNQLDLPSEILHIDLRNLGWRCSQVFSEEVESLGACTDANCSLRQVGSQGAIMSLQDAELAGMLSCSILHFVFHTLLSVSA